MNSLRAESATLTGNVNGLAVRAQTRAAQIHESEVRIEALRSADRTPICVGTTWLAAERFPEAGHIYERVRSTTKLLAHYGIRDYRRASTRVTAAIVNATDAVRLNLALGRPILVVESTDVDADGGPLLITRARFAAERVEFVVENI